MPTNQFEHKLSMIQPRPEVKLVKYAISQAMCGMVFPLLILGTLGKIFGADYYVRSASFWISLIVS